MARIPHRRSPWKSHVENPASPHSAPSSVKDTDREEDAPGNASAASAAPLLRDGSGRVHGAAVLFNPDTAISPIDALSWQQAAWHGAFTGERGPDPALPGRRPIGAGCGDDSPMLAWLDREGVPARAPDGGVYLVLAHAMQPETDADPALVFGVARNTASGEYLLWDVVAADYWPTANGEAIAIAPELMRHAALAPAEVAALIGTIVEIEAIANAAGSISAGMRSTVRTLLHAARPPSGLLHPFWPLMNSMLPSLLTAKARAEAIDPARTLIDELTAALADRAFAEAVWAGKRRGGNSSNP